MESNTSGETMQSRNNSSCRCAHAGVIFSPPHLGLSIRGCRLEAIDTTRGYVMQQGSKEKHTVGLLTGDVVDGFALSHHLAFDPFGVQRLPERQFALDLFDLV